MTWSCQPPALDQIHHPEKYTGIGQGLAQLHQQLVRGVTSQGELVFLQGLGSHQGQQGVGLDNHGETSRVSWAGARSTPKRRKRMGSSKRGRREELISPPMTTMARGR